MNHRITEYRIVSPKIKSSFQLAVISDLHNGPYQDVLPAIQNSDALAIVGDLPDRHKPGMAYAQSFLREVAGLLPVFYSIGNHERLCKEGKLLLTLAEQLGICVLNNEVVYHHGLYIGGMSSAPKRQISTKAIDELKLQNGYRLLLCHHPEMYEPYVRGNGIDLTLAGHAHGGQIELFGQGLYAPGQGILPKYTAGFYDDKKLLVSRGMTNSAHAPRLFNPCEMLLLHFEEGVDFS